jgi:hypothetical protein
VQLAQREETGYPRRSYDAGREIPPMDLANMREHGVRSVPAICPEVSCQHSGSVNLDRLPDDFPVPDVSLHLRCSACGSRNVKTQPVGKRGNGLGATGGGRFGQELQRGRAAIRGSCPLLSGSQSHRLLIRYRVKFLLTSFD